MDIAVILVTGFVIGFFISSMSLPVILRVAKEKNLYDIPDERKVHQNGIPRLGGLIFFPSLVFALSLLIGINYFYLNHFPRDPDAMIFGITWRVSFVLCALLLMYSTGVADDLVGISYRAKFLTQFMSALLLCFGDIYFRQLFGFAGVTDLPEVIGIPLSVIVIIYITNAINLVDGVDGLSSIVTGAALVFYGIYFYISGEYLFTLEAIVLTSTLIPFYVYNVFGNVSKNQKIFMGDTGSLTIGLILSSFSMHICSTTSPTTVLGYNPLVAGFVPLLLPCLDVLRVFGTRMLRGKNPFLGDRNHFHHKLLSVGFSKFGVSCVFTFYTLIVGGVTLLLSKHLNVTWLIVGNLIVYFVVIAVLNRRISRMTAPALNGEARI